MRIAIIGSRGIPARYSGVERSIEEISVRLAEKKHEIKVYCRPRKGAGKIYQNIKLIYMPTLNSKNFGTIIHSFLSTLHILFKRADIVHFHSLGPSVFSLLPRLFGKKTLVTIHGLDWERKKWNYAGRVFLKFSEYLATIFPNKTIVVSKTLQGYFKKKYGKKTYYIPNGVQILRDSIQEKQESCLSEKERYILFVGRLVPEKGAHYLIKAFNELNTDLRLIIAGESSFTDGYVRFIKKMAKPNIKFTGFVDGKALAQLYSNCYIFVLPSEVEGLPISLLEAMSYGRCVLTSDTPECLEAIGNCGFSFKAKDCNDLRKQLNNLINNPELVQEFGRKAKEYVAQTYNWDSVAENTEKVYLSLSNARVTG